MHPFRPVPKVARVAWLPLRVQAALFSLSVVVGAGIVVPSVLGSAATMAGCAQPALQTVTEVGVGLEGIGCVLDVYAVDTSAGMTLVQIIPDAVTKCAQYAVTEGQVSGILAAHRKAELREGFVVRPDGG